jgi:hypothetical protein
MKPIPELTERQSMILQAWNTGRSAGDIAADIGTTRNAIIGVVSRLRPRLKAQKIWVREREKPISPMQYRPLKIQKSISKKRAKKELKTIKITNNKLFTTPIHTNVKPIKLIDLVHVGSERGTCHWPLDMPKGTFFCGAPIDATKPYCEAHAAFAYVKKSKKEINDD